MQGSQPRPVAIIGIGCRFPGHANSPEEFWRLLCDGVEAVAEIPGERFDIDLHYDPDPSRPGKLYIRRAGFADYADRFDAAFFGISPREALHMDPQQRMLLEVGWEALEDGGQTLERLAGSRTGVFVGISTHDFGDMVASPANVAGIEAHTATGVAPSIAANRLSYVFDLRGPSIALDTACSSSLTAIHLACRSLALGECELALAGGVNLFLSAHSALGLAKASMLSPDGRCRAFDSGANGFVRGEGAGLVLLKVLDAALRDRDRIYALIRASTINQDGRTVGITVPNAQAQEAMLEETLAAAGVAPCDVQYVEAHGTGTPVGDPIEAGAIGRVLAAGRAADSPLYIASVKTNIGHLEAAAGVAGVIKTALALKHRLIPPHLNFAQPNPQIDLDGLRLKVPVTLQPWPEPLKRPIAGVNSFGFGGANAHVLLEAAPPNPEERTDPASEVHARALLLSAKSPEALRERAARLAAFLGESGPDLDDVCQTCAVRRSHLEHRVAVVGATTAELRSALDSFLRQEASANVRAGKAPNGRQRMLAMVFPGMGSPLAASRGDLLRREPVFREVIERCDAVLRPLAGWSLIAELVDGSAGPAVGEVAVAQVKNFAIQAGLTALLRAWGIVPDVVTGHSVGEIAAAHAAGALRLEDGLRLVMHRGRLAQRVSGMGRMLAAALSYEEAVRAGAEFGDRVCVAAINSDRSVTFSGEAAALEQIAHRLERDGRFCRLLPVTVPYHSRLLEGLREEFLAAVGDIRRDPLQARIASSTLGRWVTDEPLDSAHWWRNFQEPVRFRQAMDLLVDSGCDLYLEVGPHPILRTYLAECLSDRRPQAVTVGTLRDGDDDAVALLRSAAELHVQGRRVDWLAALGSRGRAIALPAYPWQHQVFGTGKELVDRNAARLGGTDSGHPLLGLRLPTARATWQSDLADARLGYLDDHRVHGVPVFPAAGYMEMALAAATQLSSETRVLIEDLHFDRMLVLSGSRDLSLQIACDAGGQFEIHGAPRDDGSWTAYAHGLARGEPRAAAGAQVELGALRARCVQDCDVKDVYEAFEARGLDYRGAFRGIQAAWTGSSEALARLGSNPSAPGARLPYCVHPAVLDSALQVLALVSAGMHGARSDATYLPARVERMAWSGPHDGQLWVHARVRSGTAASLRGDVSVLDDRGTTVLQIEGLEASLVGAQSEHQEAAFAIHDLYWTPKARSKPDRQRRAPGLPAPDALALAIGARAAGSSQRFGHCTYPKAISEGLNGAAAEFVRATLDALGCDWRGDAQRHIGALAESAGVAEQHHRLLGRLVHIARCTSQAVPPASDPRAFTRQLAARHPAWSEVIELLVRCGDALGAVLRGEREAQEVLFSPEALPILKNLYASGPCLAYYNDALAQTVAASARSLSGGGKLRVLEVGAGTGGTSAAVLAALPPGAVDYCFTDVSPYFLAQAKERFAHRSDVTFCLLDIEQAPARGALPCDAFDIVIAANVLHGTADVRAALRNVQSLLAPGGLLLLLELVSQEFWADLMFGLFQGWWRFSDSDLRPVHAVMDRQRWASALRECGFATVLPLPDLEGDPNPLHTVMLAAGALDANRAAPRSSSAQWLLVRDQSGVAASLACALEARGAQCRLVAGSEASGYVDREWRGVIHLASLDLPPIDSLSSAPLLDLEVEGLSGIADVVRCADTGGHTLKRLWLVTAGAQQLPGDAQPPAVLQAPVWALGRVMMYEFPSLVCRLVDLGATPRPEEIEALAAEICAEEDEEDLAFRGEQRLVARIRRMPQEELEPARLKRSVSADAQQVRLETDRLGTLDALALAEVRPGALAPDELLVRVGAAGLNFKDLMHALGLLPFGPRDPRADAGQVFGFECSGTVLAVGQRASRFRPGDEVCGIGTGTLASHVRIAERFAFPRPAALSLEDAAGILSVFMTAHYGLNHLARIQPGERVLIHSAAGGVGLAAIQICRRAGAEVFATAGTPEKRAFLEALGVRQVMDSRSLDFAPRTLELTGGEGVDVVLNSLAGAAIAKGLSVLRPFGRFVELGKRDLLQDSAVGLAPFERNLAFFSVDLDRVKRARPELFVSLAREIIAQFEAGQLRALPRTDFKLSDAASAFRYMAQGKHIGKIVVTAHEAEYSARPSRTQDLFRADATYLISGGLGGFGLATAQWMVEQGARHLVLTGRGVSPSPRNQPALDQLRACGADITILPADIGVEEQVAQLLRTIASTLPPLRGVFHLAMVLDDRKVLELTPESWKKVLAPKVAGAWNLHRRTRDLDYFVLFSSCTVAFGNLGQSTYAAGNAFLDALAAYRRGRGLPALSVAWGQLANIGVAHRTEVQRHLNRLGAYAFTTEEAFGALEDLLRSGAVYAMPFRMDWRKLASFWGSERKRCAEMVAAVAPDAAPEGTAEARAPREVFSGPDRQAALDAYLRSRAAAVLAAPAASIDIDTSLTSLGLDSLMAVELESVIKRDLGVQVTAVRLLQGASLRQLAEGILAQLGTRSEPARAAPVAEGPLSLPLAPGQRRLWFLQQLDPQSVAYNMPISMRMQGTLDVQALEAALNEVLRRQDALRATFPTEDGEAVQRVSSWSPIELPVVDLSGEPDPSAALERVAGEECRHVFDLAAGPLFRCRLLRLADDDHVLLASAHHLVVDGWCPGIISKQAAECYAAAVQGTPPPPGPAPGAYSRIVQRQIEHVAAREAQQIAYWKEQLRGVVPLALAADRSRSPQRFTPCARRPFDLPAGLLAGLEQLAKREGATSFMTLLAAFDILLARYSGQEDLCVGSPVASRSGEEGTQLVGCFVNTVALRARVPASLTFRELLGSTRQTVLAAFANQDVPWERVVQSLNPMRDCARLPLFQVLFVMHNMPKLSAEMPGLALTANLLSPGSSPFDLMLLVDSKSGQCALEYSASLFGEATAAAMIDDFLWILRSVLDDPDRTVGWLKQLRDAHRTVVMNEWNATETADAAVCCVHELFEQQANSTPDALAVIAEDRTLTYRQLDEEAGALALRLRDLGVGPEARVGVVLERSARAVVAVLGVLKAGGAFVPLDPACPTQRLQLMLEDTKPLALLSETCFARRLDDSRNLVMLDALDELRPSAGKRPVAEAAVEPTNLAYVMYTSGSTGKPKGVMVEHRSLCNQLAWRQAVFPLTPADAVLHATPLSFDPSVWEILGPLTCGARVIVLPCGAHDGPRVRRAILEHGVTTMQAVPSILRALLDQEAFAGCGGRLKRVFCGGEVLDSSLQERLRGAVSAELVVLYGCTETAIDATYHRCGREPMPGIIGRPIANTRAYVLDESMRPVPIGVPGLLYVAGAGVARGYLGDAELTRESFVADPHVDDEAERAYCTGDLARWLPGGQLEFLGRADRQLKLRGLRIEPAEIEAALRSHPAVQDAAVGVRHDRAANARLVAWLVSRSGAAADEAALRAFLAEKLPDYMLPSHYVPMDALPSTPSGKLDAARLPDPPACDRPYVAPRTPLEGQLARLWEELLGLPQVGVTDGFFDLGGHSLLAVRLASRMSRVLGRQILCQDLFAKPTIEALVGAHTQAAPHAPRVPLDA